MFIPMHGLLKRLFEVEKSDAVSTFVPVQKPIATNRNVARNEVAKIKIGLNRTAGSHPNEGESLMLGLNLSGLEVDVGKGVKLGYHNIKIVAANTMRECGYSLALVGTCAECELAGLPTGFNLIEHGHKEFNSSRVAEHNYGVCKLLGFDMQMEYASIVIDNKFRFRYSHDY